MLLSFLALAVLISLLFPALKSMRMKGQLSICMSHMRGAGFLLDMYSETFKGYMPKPNSIYEPYGQWATWANRLHYAGFLDLHPELGIMGKPGNTAHLTVYTGWNKANTLPDLTCPSGENKRCDNDLGRFLLAYTWDPEIAGYFPGHVGSIQFSFAVSKYLYHQEREVRDPSRYIIMSDLQTYSWAGTFERKHTEPTSIYGFMRHSVTKESYTGSMNYYFRDGHMEQVNAQDFFFTNIMRDSEYWVP